MSGADVPPPPAPGIPKTGAHHRWPADEAKGRLSLFPGAFGELAAHAVGREPLAVIDIGSNSVRLVVFEGCTRHPQTLFNEKVLCGLGRGVGTTGRMDPKAVDLAIATLERYAALCRAMGVHAIETVATAAVREAEDGALFVERVARETGIAVQILPGAEEARLSALGVLSAFPDARGLMGDLGGGSLELAELGDDGVGRQASLSIGSVRLKGRFGSDLEATHAAVTAALDSVPWLVTNDHEFVNFYAVGGAWRALARVMMAHEHTVLPILQGFSLDGGRARDLAQVIARQEPESLARIPGVPAQRAELLPQAALVLDTLFARLAPTRFVVSAFGLREGLLFASLPQEERRADPFLAACRDIARLHERFPAHARALMTWIAPLYEGPDAPCASESTAERRLREAAALLSDISWRGHPDFRAERAVMEVLYGHFVGVTHAERAWLALALNTLYGASSSTSLARLCRRLVDDEARRRAEILGVALRLAQRLSGGTREPLERTRLALVEGRLMLCVGRGAECLVNDVVERRLAALASRLDLEWGTTKEG